MNEIIIKDLYLSDDETTGSYYNQLSYKDKNQILNNQYIKKGFMLKGLDCIIKSIITIFLSFKELGYIILTIFMSFIGIKGFDGIINVGSNSNKHFSRENKKDGLLQIVNKESEFLIAASKLIILMITVMVVILILIQLLERLKKGQLYNNKTFNSIYTHLYEIIMQPLVSLKLKLKGKNLLKNVTDRKETSLVNQLNTKYYDLENNKVVLQHQIMCDAHYKNAQKQYSFNILPEFQHFTHEKSLEYNLSNEEKEIKDLLDLYIQTSMINQKDVIEKLKRELKISKIKNKQDIIDYYDRKNEEIGSKLKEIYENADDTELIKAKYDLLK